MAIATNSTPQQIALYLQGLVPTLDTSALTTAAADGAIPITASGTIRLTKGSAAAMSVAATATNGIRLIIINGSAYAHVITFTGNILDDGTSTTKLKATMAAYVGASIEVVSANSRWVLVNNNACTLAAS